MDLIRISQMIRETRKQQKLTVESLGKKAGLSKAFISRLENFRVTPSLKALSKIANALGINMADFFQEENTPVNYLFGSMDKGEEIIRNSDEGSGLSYFALAFKKPDRILDPFIIEYREAINERGFSTHDTEEFFVLLEGEVHFYIYDDTNFNPMKSGDTVYLAKDIPHKVRLKAGTEYAKALIIYSKEQLGN